MCRRTGSCLRWGLALVVVAFCASCGSGSPVNVSNSRVSGHVLAGPTCPVEQPGDTDCEPMPVNGMVQFIQDGDVIDSVTTDSSGHFSIDIRVGSYTVIVDTGDNIFPICSPVEVEVLAHVDAEVDVFCDTGIR